MRKKIIEWSSRRIHRRRSGRDHWTPWLRALVPNRSERLTAYTPTAKVAFGVSARRISAAPRINEAKKAHLWETPRSFGLTSAIASAVASLAAVARSSTASRAAVARSPIRSAPLRSSSMAQRVPRWQPRHTEKAFAEFGELAQYV